MRMARWIVFCLLRLLGAEPEHHGPFARTNQNTCLRSDSVGGFGVPKHKSHLSIYPQAAILCGFDRLMQTHSCFFFYWRGLWGRTLIPFSNLGVAKAGWVSAWNMALNVMLRQPSQHKENPSLNPPLFVGFHVRLPWMYISSPSYITWLFSGSYHSAKSSLLWSFGVPKKTASFQLWNLPYPPWEIPLFGQTTASGPVLVLFSKSTNNAMPEVRKSFSTKLTIVERVKGQAFVETLERQETFMLKFGPVWRWSRCGPTYFILLKFVGLIGLRTRSLAWNKIREDSPTTRMCKK